MRHDIQEGRTHVRDRLRALDDGLEDVRHVDTWINVHTVPTEDGFVAIRWCLIHLILAPGLAEPGRQCRSDSSITDDTYILSRRNFNALLNFWPDSPSTIETA